MLGIKIYRSTSNDDVCCRSLDVGLGLGEFGQGPRLQASFRGLDGLHKAFGLPENRFGCGASVLLNLQPKLASSPQVEPSEESLVLREVTPGM